jgi:hypothetical protein
MSKLNNTPIGRYLFVHRTNRLYTIVAAMAIWTLLTTSLTVLAINSKYFTNTYQCQSTTIQPIKTLNQPIDQKQSKLISRISTLYGVPKHKVYEVVNIVEAYTKHHKFPSTHLVLAIIGTESRFQQHATSSAGAVGLMQILAASGKPVSYEIYTNIQSGIELLREYRTALGSDSAAVVAFNVGITSYKRGLRSPDYLGKVYLNKGIIEGA